MTHVNHLAGQVHVGDIDSRQPHVHGAEIIYRPHRRHENSVLHGRSVNLEVARILRKERKDQDVAYRRQNTEHTEGGDRIIHEKLRLIEVVCHTITDRRTEVVTIIMLTELNSIVHLCHRGKHLWKLKGGIVMKSKNSMRNPLQGN